MTKRDDIAKSVNLNFLDTEQTFNHKSDFQLRKSAVLFRIMSHPGLVKMANSIAMGMAKVGFPVAWAVKPTLYRQFVGGEGLHECDKTLKDLKSRNIYSILDYSAEAGSGNSDYESIMEETLKSIRFAKNNDAIPFAVFKPTAIGDTVVLKKISFNIKLSEEELKEYDNFKNRMERLAEIAAQNDIRLLVDAEDYWYQEAIDKVVFNLMKKHNNNKAIIFNTWQMYRHDRLDNLKNTIEEAKKHNFNVGVKLVRGAYMEKERARAKDEGYPSPINSDKTATDNAYNNALELCMENLENLDVFNGTHNEYSTALLAGLMKEKGIPNDHPGVWFAQLFGMSDHITSQLAIQGYNVTKYVPYGPVREVLPYLSRRAQENTSVKGQTGRELALIKSEIRRRRLH